MVTFVDGVNYGSRTEIMKYVGGQLQHGITHISKSNLPEYDDIMLFSNSHLFKKIERKHYYLDRFFYQDTADMELTEDTSDYTKIVRALYSGIGSTGDQDQSTNINKKLNINVINHKNDCRKIHLFKSKKNNGKIEYIYVGEFEVFDYYFEHQEDTEGSERKVYVFDLVRI